MITSEHIVSIACIDLVAATTITVDINWMHLEEGYSRPVMMIDVCNETVESKRSQCGS